MVEWYDAKAISQHYKCGKSKAYERMAEFRKVYAGTEKVIKDGSKTLVDGNEYDKWMVRKCSQIRG